MVATELDEPVVQGLRDVVVLSSAETGPLGQAVLHVVEGALSPETHVRQPQRLDRPSELASGPFQLVECLHQSGTPGGGRRPIGLCAARCSTIRRGVPSLLKVASL